MERQVKLALSVLLLISLSAAIASFTGFNSDALYAYSQARDLYQFHSLSGWTFSAIPFFVPDVLVALPIAAVIHDPLMFYAVTSTLQIGLFAALVALHVARTSTTSFADTFLAAALAASALGLVGSALLGEPFYFMILPFFVFVHHGFAALAAVALYLYCRDNNFERLRKRWLLSTCGLALLAFSDFFFAVYFGLMVLATATRKGLAQFAAFAVPLGFGALLVLVISYQLNPSVIEQLANSTTPTDHSQIAVLFHSISLLLVPGLGLAWLNFSKHPSAPGLGMLYAALGLIALFIGTAGLIKSNDTYRYLTVIYAASIVIFAHLLLSWPDRRKAMLSALCLIGATSTAIYANFGYPTPARSRYQAETRCIREAARPGATIVAEYWPAKVIFESLRRTHNLVQVDAHLSERPWINNSKWRTLYRDSQTTFLVTDRIDPKVIEQQARQPLCEAAMQREDSDDRPARASNLAVFVLKAAG